MTARPLGFDFPMMSPLATRPPHAVPLDEQLLELQDEIADRRGHYPAFVSQGRLTEQDSRRHQAILARILDELTPMPADLPAAARARREDERDARRRAAPFSWEDRVRELRRELQLRRNAWPGRIAKGRLPADIAAGRIERLDALHWRYWIAGEGWGDTLAGLDPAEARERCRAFGAERIRWELAAHDAGDPAARPFTPGQIAWSRDHLAWWDASRPPERQDEAA